MAIKCQKCHFDNPEDTLYCGKCGTELRSFEGISVSATKTLQTPMKGLKKGSVFAERYEIIEELGRGGMGRVYKALDKEIDEEVAVKLLKPEIAEDEKIIDRFRNELKFARKIAHKNVCKMYHLAKDEETPYITMEYVEGEDLKSLVRRKEKITEDEAISLAKQVCEGLAEAHRLGVVHRDLKPQNVMIDKEGQAKVMDFGIARSVEAPGVTATGMMIGTPDYISPEQAEGEEADERSDIYSLGVILYEMVTGQVPFKGDTALSVALKHKAQLPSDPRKLNPDVSEDLSRLILICMEKDRERRYQRADELINDLRNIEEGLPLGTKLRPRRVTFAAALIRKKLFIPAMAFVAIIIAAVIVWQVLRLKEGVPVPSDKPSVAIMYFENNTGEESLDHWSKMLSDLLITDLSQSKYLRVLSGERLYEILSQLDQLEAKTYSANVLREVGSKGRAEHVLLGKYAKMGDTFRIDVVLQEANTGEIIGSERVEAKGEGDVFPKVDELTRRIKANFNLSSEQIASDIDRDIGEVTTSSPEAYKHFNEGVRLLAEKANIGQAIKSLKRAVAIDPNFAMAYSMLAMAYRDREDYVEWRKNLQKAFELSSSDRVTDRERFRIQADFNQFSGKLQEAIDLYNKLLELYPEDSIANFNLGWLYLGLEQWDKAIERYEVLIQNKSEVIWLYLNITHAYIAKGQFEKARKVLEYYINNFADHVLVRCILAYNYIIRGEYDRALDEMDKASLLNPKAPYVYWMNGLIYQCKGDFSKAEKEFQKLLKAAPFEGRDCLEALYLVMGKFIESVDQANKAIEQAEKRGQKNRTQEFTLRLANIYLRSGNPEAALKQCNKLSGRNALHLEGLIYVNMREIEKAQRTASELKELIQEGLNKKLMRYYSHLMGMIKLEEREFSKAVEYFQKALLLVPFPRFPNRIWHDQALFIDPLASAYYRAGNLEKAREYYERLISLPTGSLWYGDIYAKSFYMLGRICQQKGQKKKALDHYQKFLDLWKDADPGITEVEDAKKRMAVLRSQ